MMNVNLLKLHKRVIDPLLYDSELYRNKSGKPKTI